MLTLVLALAATGQIRSCQTAVTYRQSVAYASPAYQQQAVSYGHPYVEKTIFLAVEQPDAYYASLVGSQVRAELKAKASLEADADLATRVGQLAEAVTRLEGKISGNVPAPTPDPPPTPGQPPPPPTPPDPQPIPGPGASGPAGAPSAEVLAYLRTSCLKCHTAPAKAGGGFVMFDEGENLVALSPLDKVLIDQAVYLGDMPKGGKPIPEKDYSALRAWIAEDAEAIASALKACQQKGAN